MARIPLTLGAYSARSVIAEAQRCVNLYAEKNPGDAVSPYTYYPAPGLTQLVVPAGSGGARPGGLYMATSSDLYYVAGPTVYYVDPSWTLTTIGTLTTSIGAVSFADNGSTALLVDGSTNGYQIDLTTRTMTVISEAANGPPVGGGSVYAFYGGTRADVIDGFIVLNEPGTSNFYSTYTNEMVFDALYFAAKNGYSDPLVSLIVTLRQIWLIGQKTTELWFDAGDANFPFEILPGAFVQHGCVAPSSVAQVDGSIYFLSQDLAGTCLLMQGHGQTVTAINTQAIATQWSNYPTVTDAVGFCFTQNGHVFYQLNFPTADKSWRWDDTTKQWHEAVWVDGNGVEHQHRVACAAFAYGLNVGGDWQTGTLYKIDPTVSTDNGAPMYWRRGYPHLMQDGKRVIYRSFDFDMSSGLPLYYPVGSPPLFFLRWSDTRGQTYGNPVQQSLGATGQYLTQAQIRRLGMGRDRVFEVYGVIPGPDFGINGAFVDYLPSVS